MLGRATRHGELPVTRDRKFGFKVMTQRDVPLTVVPVARNLNTLTCMTWRLHNSCLDGSCLSVLFSKCPQKRGSYSNIDGRGGISTFLIPPPHTHTVAAGTGRFQTHLQTVKIEGCRLLVCFVA